MIILPLQKYSSTPQGSFEAMAKKLVYVLYRVVTYLYYVG